MGDEKIGFANWNTTTFKDGSASRSVVSAPNSTIVVGTNMLIGGLLKVTMSTGPEPQSSVPVSGPDLLNRLALALDPADAGRKSAQCLTQPTRVCHAVRPAKPDASSLCPQ